MATSIVMPRLGDFMTEGTVTRWTKVKGDHVDQGEVLAEIESEKLNYDLEATVAGFFHPVVNEGDTVPVDGVLGYVLAEGEAPPAQESPQVPTPAAGPSASSRPARAAAPVQAGDAVPSTPGARRLAASLEVDISRVTPTGPRGRVVDADVRAYAESQGAAPAPQAPPGMPQPSKTVPLGGMRRTIATHMKNSLSGTAQLSYFLEVDVTDAQALRREKSRGSEGTITMAQVLVKACAESLKRNPVINTLLVDGNVLYFDEINIGVAVALDDGLIVPVLRNVENKSLLEISQGVHELTEKARVGRLSATEVTGGTFTISVLGSVDGFTPILNRPQNALLGVGRSVQKPVVRGGEIVVREMMTISLTGDHQVIDGALAASFLRRLQQLIERPSQLFS
ncbi:MAG: 2-oxo acid dehydrogenase subunit E2 [Chloroflexi bacterium]|nr:2-oxo acid dehydrogenase subunit E2 [Chloroflexota bacterium]